MDDDDLDELYQELIMDHGRRPRNTGALPDSTHHGRGHNPLCGDQLKLFLNLDGDIIKEATFVGSGCCISKASASLLTDAVKGKTREEAEALFARFHALVLGQDAGGGKDLGPLVVFSGVSRFPVRVKCASLAWHTLKAALDDGPTDAVPSISTEA